MNMQEQIGRLKSDLWALNQVVRKPIRESIEEAEKELKTIKPKIEPERYKRLTAFVNSLFCLEVDLGLTAKELDSFIEENKDGH